MTRETRSKTNSITTTDIPSLEDQMTLINTTLQEIKADNKIIKETGLQNSNNCMKIHDDIAHMKDVIIHNLVESNKELQESNKDLQAKVDALEKKVHNLTKETTVSIEANNQYVRCNNIEISGVPNNITDDNLEDEVIDILGKIDVKVRKRDIEACHRLPPTRKNPNKRVIIRFFNRKNTEKCLENKKKLENIEMSDLNYPNKTRLFISENLNAHYRKIGWNCRRLKRAGLISEFKYQNEAYSIKVK